MSTYVFDQAEWKTKLVSFFQKEKADLNAFGSKVNQTFEAATFAKVVKYYKEKGWIVSILNPLIRGTSTFRLKFSTRGAPKNFSYAKCKKNGEEIEIRHQLRVKTRFQPQNGFISSNMCCDIAVIRPELNIDQFSTSSALDNANLIAFGEAKHMSAYPELLASFIGLVHEMQPERLNGTGKPQHLYDHLNSFLNISGYMIGTSNALVDTFTDRDFAISIYHCGHELEPL